MYERKPNEIGVGWRKENEIGKYVSISLVELAGGATETVNISMYPITSDNEKAPHFQLKYFPKKGSGTGSTTGKPPAAAPRRPRPPVEDDDPF
jgi:uncharacterized protein (DUF736 family)